MSCMIVIKKGFLDIHNVKVYNISGLLRIFSYSNIKSNHYLSFLLYLKEKLNAKIVTKRFEYNNNSNTFDIILQVATLKAFSETFFNFLSVKDETFSNTRLNIVF